MFFSITQGRETRLVNVCQAFARLTMQGNRLRKDRIADLYMDANSIASRPLCPCLKFKIQLWRIVQR